MSCRRDGGVLAGTFSRALRLVVDVSRGEVLVDVGLEEAAVRVLLHEQLDAVLRGLERVSVWCALD